MNGAEDWNRTSDTSIFSAVLYQLSYLGTAPRRWQNPHDTRSLPVVRAPLAPVDRVGARIAARVEMKAGGTDALDADRRQEYARPELEAARRLARECAAGDFRSEQRPHRRVGGAGE